MSKYTTDKNGIVVGSDNWWVYWDENKVIQDGFRSILWAGQYSFDNINTLTYNILTPAQQLLCTTKTTTVIKKYKDEEWEEDDVDYVIKDWWIEHMLPKLCKKKFGVAPYEKSSMGSPSIFFESVKDAWAVRKYIAEQLKEFPRIKVR